MPEVQLQDSERQECEVFSRVMGYHRPVSYYNHGKRQEFRDRLMFTERKCARIIERTVQ